MLKTDGSDVRHGTSCSLLSDEEARSYGIAFNSGFGEFVLTVIHMTDWFWLLVSTRVEG
jgi:hypothetical protein